MVIVIAIITVLLIPLVFRWVIGIDYMHENHPDYKGEDLFDEDKEETKDKPLK